MAGAPAAGGEQGIKATITAVELSDAGNIENVGNHCGGCWPRPGTGAVEHHPADWVTFHKDGVVDATHSGKWVILRHQRGLDTDAQRQGSHGIPIAFQTFCNSKQLHAVSQLRRVVDVPPLQIADACCRNGAAFDRTAKGQSGKDRDLVRGVMSVNISGRIRFRIAQFLGFL